MPIHKIDVRGCIQNIRREWSPSIQVARQAFPSAPDATLRVFDSGLQGNVLRDSRSMPCKQVLLALEFRRERRRLRAACAHDRCAPLLRHHHHHRSRQHQRHNHDISDDNGENDHRMIVIGERAIDLRCIWQVLDGRTKPCAVRSVMAGRSLAAVRSLDKAKPWMAGRSLARYVP